MKQKQLTIATPQSLHLQIAGQEKVEACHLPKKQLQQIEVQGTTTVLVQRKAVQKVLLKKVHRQIIQEVDQQANHLLTKEDLQEASLHQKVRVEVSLHQRVAVNLHQKKWQQWVKKVVLPGEDKK